MVSQNRRRQSGDDGSNRSSSEVKASPHFFKIIHSSGVPHQKLRVPMKFISQYVKNLGNHVFLKSPRGAVWKLELEKSNGVVWMCNGWKEFAKYYSIGFGHLLVFRYDGNCNFNVLIFDTSASEIEYPVSATHGEQTNINGNGKSKIHVTEDAIEIDDSVVTLGDTPCATYNTKREEICGRGEFEKLSVQTRQKTRQASYYRANIEKDASVKILDDSLVRDSPVSERKRANTKSGMENNSNMHEFSPDIQCKGLKLPNQKMDVKTEIETEEGAGGTSTGLRRHQSQIPVKMLSTTANMNSRALERARDFKSKKPFFTVHMQPSYVSGPSTRRSGGKVAEASGSGEQIEHPSFTVVITKLYRSRLTVKKSFARETRMAAKKSVKLRNEEGKEWTVDLCIRNYPTSYGRIDLGVGWPAFCKENEVVDGDSCLFKFIKSAGDVIDVVVQKGEEGRFNNPLQHQKDFEFWGKLLVMYKLVSFGS